jgi:hypothetical protein
VTDWRDDDASKVSACTRHVAPRLCTHPKVSLTVRHGFTGMSRPDNFLARLVKSIAGLVGIFHGKRTALSALRQAPQNLVWPNVARRWTTTLQRISNALS